MVQEDWTLRKALKAGRFWALIFFPSCTSFGMYIIIVHHVRYLVDLGVDKIWAASLFAGIGAISAIFRFVWGWLSDRIGREITYTIGLTCSSSGVLFLLLYQFMPSIILLYLFAILFGTGWGGAAPLIMSISADLFKGRIFGLIFGILEGFIGIAGALGAWIAGLIYDNTQNYFWAFILCIFLKLVSILLVWLAAPRKYRQRKTLPA